MSKEFKVTTLSNGIELVYEKVSRATIAHAGFIINAGSRDENLLEHGMAHFIEHCVFKGTKNKTAEEIITQSEGLGGELNAYTTKEDTSVYASFVTSNWKSQIALLVDVLFGSVFPKKELDKEKTVIYDEMNYYLDSPSELIYEQFDSLLFSDHPIGRPILGTKKSVSRFEKKQVFDFVKRLYQNKNNVVFVFSGSLPLKDIKKYLEKVFKPYQFSSEKLKREVPTSQKVFHKTITKKVNQTHLLLGKSTHGYKHKYNWELAILNHYFGGNTLNSRLNLVLREKNGLTYQAESNYQPFSDSGIFSIYVSMDAASLPKVKSLIEKECRQMQKGIGEKEYKNLKQQFTTQFLLARENRLNNILAMGKAQLTMNKVHTDEQILNKIKAIKLKNLNKVAKDLFAFKTFSSLTYISK